MLKKIIPSVLGLVLICSAFSAPPAVRAEIKQDQDSIEQYMIFDPEDYGSNMFYNDSDMGYLYKSTNPVNSPDEVPINESIIGLDESVVKVMIDPGHCGYENRSPVYSPYYESVMTWKLSNYLQEELNALGAHADLTKSSLEEEPPLKVRGQKSKGYDFFISIHSNAASYSSIDKPVALCYQNLDWTTIDDTSREIGGLLASKVAEVMQTNQKGEIFQRLSAEDRDKNGVWDDEWYGVLCGSRYVSTPGILLEHSFHTNYRATLWLSDDDNLKKLAKEEAAVIFDYFTEKKGSEGITAPTTTATTTTEITTTEASIEITTETSTTPETTITTTPETSTTTATTTVRIDPIPVENGKSGDVDGDGSVSIQDAMLTLEYYARNAAGLEAKFIWSADDPNGEKLIFKAADMNNNGTIDISDAVAILSLYAKNAAGV